MLDAARILVLTICIGIGGNVWAQSPTSPCAVLQAQLLALPAGSTHQLPPGPAIVCATQSGVLYAGDTFDAGLLVPEGITLDLNNREIQLSLQGGATYGIRLARSATIQNGVVSVIASTGAGDQAVWHCAISVGAAYGHGGTAINPSYFSKVGHWKILNIIVNQPFPQAAIGIISESHDGLIDEVTISSSTQALVGIGMDWGTVGNVDARRQEIPRMKSEYLAGDLYTTHPHDIDIRNVTIEHLTRIDDDDHSGIRTSAAYNIRIDNVLMHEVGSGIVFRAGDLGFEFAQTATRPYAHSGLVAENFTINHAHRKGVIVDGYADNVYDAYEFYGYDWLLDPRLPGMLNAQVRFGFIRGGFHGDAGVFVENADGLLLEDVDVESFATGLKVERATRNSTVWRSRFAHNSEYGIYIKGSPYRSEAPLVPDNLAFVDNQVELNGLGQYVNVNATNVACGEYYCPPRGPLNPGGRR